LNNVYSLGDCVEASKETNKFNQIYNFIKKELSKKKKDAVIGLSFFKEALLLPETSSLGVEINNINAFSPVVNIGFCEADAVSNFGTYIRNKVYSSPNKEGFFKIVYKENNDQILGIILAGDFAKSLENFAIISMRKKIKKAEIEEYLKVYWAVNESTKQDLTK
jgi:pyruvate/2-oxoglutarate dehydrogenase complex dihydrolipoamide dehydrogenase (E3) component